MTNYNKQRFLENVAYLMKIRGVKVGELEAAAGVSTGYFSRLKNNDNEDTCPSIDTLSEICKKLGCTLNTLLYCDFTTLTETEKYIQDFLTKIIDQTSNKQLEWEKVTRRQLTSQSFDGKFYPFLQLVDNNLYYKSLFTDDDVELIGSVFVLDRLTQKFFITKIKHKYGINIYHEYELYIYKNGALKKICNGGFESKNEIFDLLLNLYQAAEISSKVLKIDDDVKKGIDDFLSNKDGDIPF